MHQNFGYQTITPLHIGNVVSAYQRSELDYASLRVYFAAFELKAIRDAARRTGSTKRRGSKFVPNYREDEIQRLTGLSIRFVRRSLRKLKKLGVMTFTNTEIVITETAIEGSRELVEEIRSERSPARPIPIPRALLRFLARCERPALFMTLLAHFLRGLSIDRKTSEVRNRGTVKLSWVSSVFEISERAARYARQELIQLVIITKDTGSFQRKLNRDGAYFELDLFWGKSTNQPRRENAGPTPKISTQIAAPYKDMRTPYGSKDQKTRVTEPSGVFKKREGEGAPRLSNVVKEDLQSFFRTRTLYEEAVRKKIIGTSEADFLNWVAAAVRAKTAKEGDPVKIFMGIVRKRLFTHVTQEEEDRARRAIRNFQEHMTPASSDLVRLVA